MPSVALLHHFFFLRINEGHIFGCANFIAASKANSISKTGKRAEDFRSKWAMMDAKCADPRLAAPSFHGGWPRAELADERAALVLGQMVTDLKPGNVRAEKVMGVMLLREFLTLRVAPLEARARPCGSLKKRGT